MVASAPAEVVEVPIPGPAPDAEDSGRVAANMPVAMSCLRPTSSQPLSGGVGIHPLPEEERGQSYFPTFLPPPFFFSISLPALGDPTMSPLAATQCAGSCECINLPALKIDVQPGEPAECPCGTNCWGTRYHLTVICDEEVPDPICTVNSGPKDCWCRSGTEYYWNCCTGTGEGEPCHACNPCNFFTDWQQTNQFDYRCPTQLCLMVEDC